MYIIRYFLTINSFVRNKENINGIDELMYDNSNEVAKLIAAE